MKQEKLLQNDEKIFLNVFLNSDRLRSNLKKQDLQKEFSKQLILLRSKDFLLYSKIIKIQNNLGINYAKKYLNNYLEYHKIPSLSDYINQ